MDIYVHLCMEDKEQKSIHLKLDIEDYNFMVDYKKTHKISVQDFVESAVKEKILTTRVQIQLNEQ